MNRVLRQRLFTESGHLIEQVTLVINTSWAGREDTFITSGAVQGCSRGYTVLTLLVPVTLSIYSS
jgi:hypothetical protein